MTQVEIDIREIKEDLKEIKNTLAKMQEDIKLLENNVLNYPTTYQYSPECFDKYPMYDNWQSCSVPPTQATNYLKLQKDVFRRRTFTSTER